MPSYRQAISHWPLSKLDDADFRKIYQLGITGIEMPPAASYKKYRDMGFEIATIAGHNSLVDGLNKVENHSRIADELRANLEVAGEFGIANLICFSGNREGKSDEEGAHNTIAGLAMVAKDAETAGVNLIVELINSKVDHADYQCDRTAWGVGVVSAVASPRVKLLYDIYHMQIMEGDLIRTIRDNIQHIAHFHTAGNPGRNELDENQEIYYPAVARAIDATGYSGWVGHEFIPRGNVLESVRQAQQQFAL
jgi:hydroxypyruvate isomerase